MKLRLKRFLPFVKRCLISCLKIAASAGFGYLTYYLLAPVAYAERGYVAYGGECLLAIAMTIFMAWFLFHKPSSKSLNQKQQVVTTEIPKHPNCRCTVSPIFDYEKQSGQ